MSVVAFVSAATGIVTATVDGDAIVQAAGGAYGYVIDFAFANVHVTVLGNEYGLPRRHEGHEEH